MLISVSDRHRIDRSRDTQRRNDFAVRSIQAIGTACLAAACALTAGCVGQSVVGVRTQPARPISTELGVQPCQFTITAIDDRRDDKSLGQLFGTTISGDEFVEWLSTGLTAIPGHVPADEPGDAPIGLRVEILKAYIQMNGSAKSANLVVRTYATVKGEAAPQVMTYRGVDTSPWNGMEVEIRRAFNRALADLQLKLGTDLSRTCKR